MVERIGDYFARTLAHGAQRLQRELAHLSQYLDQPIHVAMLDVPPDIVGAQQVTNMRP